MVSLGNESGRSGAGNFFDGINHSLRSTDSEDLMHESASLVTQLEPPYRRIHTTWIIMLQMLLVIGLEVVAFIDPLVCSSSSCPISGFDVTVYTHALLWFLYFVIDRSLNYLHNRSRMSGYLDFYRQTKCVRRLPFFINSFANVVLVVVSTIIHHYCPQHCGAITSNNVLQILVSLEVFITLLSTVVYLYRTLKFNRVCAVPDVQRDELASSFINARSVSTEIGFKDDDYLDQVLEKQADMIRYLKQHSTYMAKRVLTLTEQLNKASR